MRGVDSPDPTVRTARFSPVQPLTGKKRNASRIWNIALRCRMYISEYISSGKMVPAEFPTSVYSIPSVGILRYEYSRVKNIHHPDR